VRPSSNKLSLALIVVLCLGAAGLIVVLQHRTGEDRDAELRVEKVRAALTQLQAAPYGAVAPTDGEARYVRQENRFAKFEIAGGQEFIDDSLRLLADGSAPAELAEAEPILEENYRVIEEIYGLGSTVGPVPEIERLGFRSGRLAGELDRLLKQAEVKYHRRSVASRNLSVAGSLVMIGLLLAAFAFFHLRSGRLQREKEDLLAVSRREALTDSLTGLGNRRALLGDLEERIRAADEEHELILAIFDLDGFKQYNDTFGHPAGDALLKRLGGRLADLASEGIAAYRMGGDEFCVVAALDRGGAEVQAQAAELLSESGDAFTVGCSYGTVVIPGEADTASDALRISDQRMYSNKRVRGTARRQSTDVLLKVLEERTDDLADHVHDVAELASLTGREMGLSDIEIERLHVAAQLHDIGKCAIPEAILNKPTGLDEDEWRFMRQHTLIGARIVLAAPALAHTADLIRSSHERVDGRGYPDGLEGDAIPLGARIIAVCDAYDAMLSERSYAVPMSSEDAFAELDRCAGTQFDPQVVRAFRAAIKSRAAYQAENLA